MNADEDQRPCQWPRCSLDAGYEIHFENERIFVCKAHREAVTVNIENHGKIWIFQDLDANRANQPVIRPGEQKPRFKGRPAAKPARVGQTSAQAQQEAAKKADEAARPVDVVPELVQPRKRPKSGK